MVPILVACTVVCFLLADLAFEHRRRRAAAEAAPTASRIPPGATAAAAGSIFVHPGHTWVHLMPSGAALVGATDFATHFAGKLRHVELPLPGRRLRQGEPGWTLVSQRQRRLSQAMPIDGKVLEVNREVLRQPHLAQEDPFGMGWLLRIRPRRVRRNLRNLMHGAGARMWLDSSRSNLATRLSPALGRLALDGGEWLTGFGDLLSDADWQQVRSEMFPWLDGANADRRRRTG